jgi:signal transduction histidine kinase
VKIRLKLTLLFAGLFAAVLLVFSLVIYFSNASQREEEYFKRLKQLAITKTNLLLEAKVQPAVLQVIYENSLNTLPQEEVAVFDTGFNLLYHDVGKVDRLKETRGMIDSIIGLKEVHFYVEDLQAIGFVYSFKGKDYVVTAAAKDDSGLSKLRHLRYNLVIGFAAAILLTLLAGILFSRKALAPVSKMVEKVGEISANRLDLRIDTGSSRDEIAELARTFNEMLDRLESSFDAQKQFVSNISHELRTPLAAIIAELEISAFKDRTAEEYRETIRLILQDAQRLSRLSNDLLDLAKASYDQSGIHFRPVRLDEVLLDARQSILRMNGSYRVDIRFEKEPEEGDGVVIRGNEYLLRVAFINLIENACKFSDDHRCSVGIYFNKTRTILKFADDGIGIPGGDVEYVFTPFYRGQNKKHAPGNGIGLSLTQKIVALHKGKITVESRLGEGTTFTVEL